MVASLYPCCATAVSSHLFVLKTYLINQYIGYFFAIYSHWISSATLPWFDFFFTFGIVTLDVWERNINADGGSLVLTDTGFTYSFDPKTRTI